MPYQYLEFIMQELMFAMTITKFPCNINNNMHNFYYYIYHAKLTCIKYKQRIAHVNFVSLTLTSNETTSCPIPVYYFFS